MARRVRGGRPWQCTGQKRDKFVQLYMSRLLSPACRDLTDKQLRLLLCCELEAHGAASKANNPDDGSAPYDASLFYMNRRLYVDRYGLYGKNDRRGFQRDMAALIEHGFVDCVKSGYAEKVKNLYRLSQRWRQWGTESFKMPESAKTTHMLWKAANGAKDL